jgi:Tol biopolymer transport system component
MRHAFSLLLLVLAASQALAGPPLRRWSTLKTDCCDITFHDGLTLEAQHAARAAQESHDAVTRLLGYVPGERTQIILTDDTDFSNGSATPVPYNVIRLYARPPGAFSDLQDYDDWMRALIVHEYTHIVHTDLIRGVPWLLNSVFGKFWPPNMLQPRWFIEGLAVFVETRMTTGGRAQSSLFDMYLRTAALHGRLWELDVLSSGGRAFPGGNGAYLYGGHFLTWLANRYGQDIYAKIARRYGGYALPWTVSTASEEFLGGKSYPELYNEWRLELTQQALALQQRVEAEGRSPERRLTALGQSVFYPRSLPGGRVVFYAQPADDVSGLFVATPRHGEPPQLTRITEAQSVQGLSPTPDGRSVVFSQPEVYANAYSYLDLFRADLSTGDVTRITAGARLRDPDVHPDGHTAMAVENLVGRSRLVLVDLDTGAVRPVFGFEDGAEIHSPRFNARGDSVVFTAWRPGGSRDVYVLHPGEKEPTRLTQDRALDMHPCFSDDGKSVYFSSERGGVYNIYRHDLATHQEHRATNVVSGAFMPLPLERDGALLYVGFGEDAFDLYATPLSVDTLVPVAPYPDEGPGKPLPSVAMTEPQPYDPLDTMMPRVWKPVMAFNSLLGLTLGATVTGEDLVGNHAYAADLRVVVPAADYSWALSYQYNRFPIPLTLNATGYVARQQNAALGDGVRGPWTEDVIRGEVGTLVPFSQWRQSHAVFASYGLELRRPREEPIFHPDGTLPNLPGNGPNGYVTLAYAYSNIRGVRDGVSIERGRRILARLRVGHPALISRYELLEFNGEYREYIPVPGLPRHVWFLSMQGGVARGDLAKRRSFFLGGLPSAAFIFVGGGLLRGYPPGALVGDGFGLITAEWRFPVLEIQQGFNTFPVFVDRVRGLVFLDQGLVFRDFPRGANLKRGVGAELLVDVELFLALPFTGRLGVARGLDAGGQDMQLYMVMGLDS